VHDVIARAAKMMSLPPRPNIRSLPPLPRMTSSPRVPTSFSSKRAIVKKLPAGSGTALRSQLTALRTDAREARKASGR